MILADEQTRFGGRLLAERFEIDGAPALGWVEATLAELERLPEVTLLPRTTAFGYYDHNLVALVEEVSAGRRAGSRAAPAPLDGAGAGGRAGDRGDRAAAGVCRQRPAGGHAGGRGPHLSQPLRRGAGRPRGRVHDLRRRLSDRARSGQAAGVAVAAVVDARSSPDRPLAPAVRAAGIEILTGHVVSRAQGGASARGGRGRPARGDGGSARGASSATCWRSRAAGSPPSISTARPARGRSTIPSDQGVPARASRVSASARPGAAAGQPALAACLASGLQAGAQAAAAAGHGDGGPPAAPPARPTRSATCSISGRCRPPGKRQDLRRLPERRHAWTTWRSPIARATSRSSISSATPRSAWAPIRARPAISSASP